jgi:tetratricopeptide (TPR) repeat protein
MSASALLIMDELTRIPGSGRTPRGPGLGQSSAAFLHRTLAILFFLAGSFVLLQAQHPFSEREAYNDGTRFLEEKDYSKAESLLHSVVARNDERTQTPALYNLGLARFAMGAEALQKAPDARAVSSRARAASAGADGAMQDAFQALRTEEQQALLGAYLRGRGARRQLKHATKALAEALEAHQDVLAKWQRASGDFHSAVELNPQDEDAAHNADVTDRHIARLVDSIRQMMAMMQGLEGQMKGLEEMLGELRGKLPDGIEPGPAPGDEEAEEDEEFPDGPKPGMEEGRGREGRERPISPEMARQLLEGFQLDRDRQLPMGFEKEAKPEDRKGKNW